MAQQTNCPPYAFRSGGHLTDERLTDELAVRVLGWRLAPDRYLTGERGWIPRWRFKPLNEIATAFELLDRATDRYNITCAHGGFNVEVHAGTRQAQASGDHLARTIVRAVAEVVGVEAQS